MKSVSIQPLSSRKENIFLLTIIAVILVIAYTLIQMTAKPDEGQEVLDYQISAYKDLSNVENSFYTDLTNSLIDIQAIYEEEGKIPEIHTLEEERISPFVRDSIWENRGSLEWRLLKKDGKSYYLGISKNVNVVGNFLLAFDESNMDKSKIYFNQEQDDGRSLPHSIAHIKEHWKEVLPYTGQEERKKF